MKEVIQIIKDFRTDRPTMDQNNSLPMLMRLLAGELEEAQNANIQELPSEVCDVIIYGLNILIALGVDPEEEIKNKLAWNHCQHSAVNYQSGDFEINRRTSKLWIKDRHFTFPDLHRY